MPKAHAFAAPGRAARADLLRPGGPLGSEPVADLCTVLASLRPIFHRAAWYSLWSGLLVLVPTAFLLDVSRVERALMVAVCVLALIVELLNSAVEAAIDRISLERHPLSKNAKDMGSAAQFTALSLIALVWAIILLG